MEESLGVFQGSVLGSVWLNTRVDALEEGVMWSADKACWWDQLHLPPIKHQEINHRYEMASVQGL